MKLEKLYKYQIFFYCFIIIFGIQNYYLNKYNFEWYYYENIVIIVFFLSVIATLSSLFILTFESIKTINRKKQDIKEVFYLIANLILYYIVIWISLYLSTQVRL